MRKIALALAFLLLAQPALAFRFEVGVFSGDGTDNRNISTAASFAIDALLIKCNAAQQSSMRTSSIPGDLTDSIGVGGGLTANRIQSLGTGTFQVGTSSTVNVSGTDNCFYVAWGADSQNDLAVGTYVGNGADDRDITISPAFTPGFVIIPGEQDAGAHFKLTAFPATNSIAPTTSAITTDRIQAFNANGFQVGTNLQVNDGTGGTVDYYPLSVKDVTNFAASGTYTATGSPTDDLEITVGFQPDFVLVKSDTSAGAAVIRTSAMTGDFACSLLATACAANIIQSFTATGFKIGTDATVQSASVKYWWYAIKTPVYASTRRVAPIIFQ